MQATIAQHGHGRRVPVHGCGYCEAANSARQQETLQADRLADRQGSLGQASKSASSSIQPTLALAGLGWPAPSVFPGLAGRLPQWHWSTRRPSATMGATWQTGAPSGIVHLELTPQPCAALHLGKLLQSLIAPRILGAYLASDNEQMAAANQRCGSVRFSQVGGHVDRLILPLLAAQIK